MNFTYMQRVRVVKGFYKGTLGKVLCKYPPSVFSFKRIPRYFVGFDNVQRSEEFPEDFLEAVK